MKKKHWMNIKNILKKYRERDNKIIFYELIIHENQYFSFKHYLSRETSIKTSYYISTTSREVISLKVLIELFAIIIPWF